MVMHLNDSARLVTSARQSNLTSSASASGGGGVTGSRSGMSLSPPPSPVYCGVADTLQDLRCEQYVASACWQGQKWRPVGI